MEILLRAADERVSWKSPGNELSPETPIYAFLPGVYTSTTSQVHSQHQEGHLHDPQPPQSLTPIVATIDADGESDGSKTRVILHGDNTFEYVWIMKRSGVRAMEFTVEMEGGWTKPVLNRTRRGEEDQRIFLSAKRIRFQRLSNYGSTGAALPGQILSNSPACRILAGLTKKIANKLGAPIDVMTEKWLPARGVRLTLAEDTSDVLAKKFNPFFWYAKGLLCTTIQSC
ncbi:Hypothetical protein PHPALM_9487 [Phytophthora palmivora]|uniref:Uncharacterized protein n=1 Tax=Phytophthora palmivora TaxID=4796 RepID=A0A2P4Y7I7_9STRA|nr:Hypothetical protein PHPALM_9487 [Phytophthora palmivora]